MSDYTDPQYWPALKQLAGNIDTMDYFQILNLPQDCTPADVKRSYYDQSRSLHPDAFYQIAEEDLRNAISKIFKRITEAYNVLRDAQKRKIYTQNINGPQRDKLLRFNEQSEAEQKQQEKQEKEVTQNPKAKPLYLAAVQKMQAQNWDGAFKDLQTAIMFDPSNDKLKTLRDEVGKKRAAK